jgi:ABC-type sugar transport system substrate-binding protein
MKKVRLLSMIALVIAFSVLVSACNPQPQPKKPQQQMMLPWKKPSRGRSCCRRSCAGGSPHIWSGDQSVEQSFWEMVHEGAMAVAEANTLSCFTGSTKSNNLEEQTRLVDDLIAKKVDGIVLVPSIHGIVPAIERATQPASRCIGTPNAPLAVK